MTVARMGVGEKRGLSGGEKTIAASLFTAPELDVARLRVGQTRNLFFSAVVPVGRTIWFSRWRAAWDFAAAGIDEQGWFVHELTHCWQAQNGIFLAAAKLAALGDRAYRYVLTPGKPLARYNIEQQAEIARHLFLARCGGLDFHRGALEEIWRRDGGPPQSR